MQPALDSTILDRLVSLGRERGHLTTEDLRAGLPVETMSADEIARIVAHLEETGVPVELEDGLLSPKEKPVPRRSAEIIPFPRPRADRRRPGAKPLQPARPALPQAGQDARESPPFAHWAVAGAGMLAFAVFSLIIFATVG